MLKLILVAEIGGHTLFRVELVHFGGKHFILNLLRRLLDDSSRRYIRTGMHDAWPGAFMDAARLHLKAIVVVLHVFHLVEQLFLLLLVTVKDVGVVVAVVVVFFDLRVQV